MNNIIFEKELNEKITSALEKIYKAVSCTLGPKGKNVIISPDEGKPYITNDGVTIANSIKLDDEIENIIVEIVKEAAIKTNDNAGDGTTTSIILTYELYKESLKYKREGISEKDIIKEIKLLEKDIINEIDKNTLKNLSSKDLYSVAKVSSSDPYLATLITDAYTLDDEINLLIEENDKEKTELDIIYGMKLECGFENYTLIEDNKQEIIINNPNIKIENNIIYDFNELDLSKDIIICNDYDENIIKDLKSYNIKNNNKLYLLKAPYYGEKKEEILKDIDYFIKEKTVEKIKIRKNETILYTNDKSSQSLNNRINYLKERLENEEFDFEKDIIKSRISNLKSKIACIKVGAPTEIEKIEKKMKIEDAIYSVSNAKKYGISLGGGLTFYNISKSMKETSIGKKILKSALSKPIEKLFENSSLNFKESKNKLTKKIGLNAETEKIEDLSLSGIFDSSKVLKEIIKNSISISMMLLSTDVLIINNINSQKINIDNIL